MQDSKSREDAMKNKKLQCQPEFGQVWLDQLVKKTHRIARVADLIDCDAIERDLEQYFPSDNGISAP